MFVLFDHFKYLYVQACVKISQGMSGVREEFQKSRLCSSPGLLPETAGGDPVTKNSEWMLRLYSEMLLPDSGIVTEEAQYS